MRFARIGFTLVALGALGTLCGAGCSSATPPSADGAYQVHFVGGNGCNVSSNVGQLGSVTATAHGAVVTDGTDGAQVTCSVTGAGPFNVSADILLGADSLSIRVPSLPASATKASPATGGASFTSATTVKTFAEAAAAMPACSFYFVAGSQESIAPGKAWLAFTCPMVSDGQDTCQIYESYVLLENCAQ